MSMSMYECMNITSNYCYSVLPIVWLCLTKELYHNSPNFPVLQGSIIIPVSLCSQSSMKNAMKDMK